METVDDVPPRISVVVVIENFGSQPLRFSYGEPHEIVELHVEFKREGRSITLPARDHEVWYRTTKGSEREDVVLETGQSHTVRFEDLGRYFALEEATSGASSMTIWASCRIPGYPESHHKLGRPIP